jgi:hypothetical protein
MKGSDEKAQEQTAVIARALTHALPKHPQLLAWVQDGMAAIIVYHISVALRNHYATHVERHDVATADGRASRETLFRRGLYAVSKISGWTRLPFQITFLPSGHSVESTATKHEAMSIVRQLHKQIGALGADSAFGVRPPAAVIDGIKRALRGVIIEEETAQRPRGFVAQLDRAYTDALEAKHSGDKDARHFMAAFLDLLERTPGSRYFQDREPHTDLSAVDAAMWIEDAEDAVRSLR